MHVTKIKRLPNAVHITRLEVQGPNEAEIVLKSIERPAPEFDAALRAFVDLVLALLHLPDTYRENLQVTGLSINYEDADERMGLVVTCQKHLPEAKAPLILNTPHLRQALDGEVDPGFFIKGMEDALEVAIGEAKAFINGRREQHDIFADQHEAAEAKKFEGRRGRKPAEGKD